MAVPMLSTVEPAKHSSMVQPRAGHSACPSVTGGDNMKNYITDDEYLEKVKDPEVEDATNES